MKENPVDRQSIADITIQATGGMESLFKISRLNDISISEPLNTDRSLAVNAPANKEVIVRYDAKGIKPATDISGQEETDMPYGGIGFMGVEIDFVVS